ncbi:bifunctional diaminohydroxyphosphoribosylaminopyrimidine deaminase/5-amino-6-(5-phosphoribosylamino)uracil reductase RibD [Telmatospirillum sp. J64-1]|uniref:bifunctional diaminohydroxyphosphoribosylaminopyrimidine deaminase/5-amino-6-(5-phosphoribosylamino)uracil reductase RibD n=1 Tax=Telmatospirillum sp. J64-1 TaxID=2502183 RepID=UPI0021024C9A|nr:bifunctional diaminohydroxyphosphoribosylaminopyrimidine deaminase/5-amino-6-(5-phosphoribosylamino)uracil reductase RibD [Telmatospirillum sp. J64-1]
MATISENGDLAHMRAALGLARRGLGQVWPNPAVGCVIVKDGRVVGRGWTQPGGRPHAETVALAQAGAAAQGATAYVTLEPCSHHGKTPPCADALVQAGIARVVAAVEDPDPRVSGNGLRRLREAGVAVELGLGAEEAEEINAGFFLRVRQGRPLITLKTATTLDGRIATHGGESQWITGEGARAHGHRLRAEHDAILVGAGTALADDPMLTCRLPGLEQRSPVRVVLDGHLRLALTAKLVATAQQVPTWLVCLPGNDAARIAAFRSCGVQVIEIPPDKEGYPDLKSVSLALGDRGITRLLVEGGARVTAAFLRHRLVDRLAWFRAPRLMGGDGMPAASAFGVDVLGQTPHFRRSNMAEAGADLIEYYERV